MSDPDLVYVLSRRERLLTTWLGIRSACAKCGVSMLDPRIAWATICALWSAL